MKRFTLILSLMVAMVTTAMAQTAIDFADFDATKTYRIYNMATTKGDTENKAMSYNASNKGCLKVYNAADLTQNWKLVASGEGYLLYNVSADKYLGAMGGNYGASMVDEANAKVYNITVDGDGKRVAFWHSDINQPRNYLWNDGGNNLYGWKDDADPNHLWYMEEVKDQVVCNVVYKYTYNGEVFMTQTHEVVAGVEFPNANLDLYGFTAEKPSGTVTESNEYEIPVTIGEQPFEYYENYAAVEAANGWYNLVMHSNQGGEARFRTYLGAGNETKLAWGENRSLTNAGDEYYWAFVGDPINGFRVINKAKGEGFILSSDGSANPVLLEETALPEGYNTTWKIVPRTLVKNNDWVEAGDWFCLKYRDAWYMNANSNSGIVNFWNEDDNGSGILAVKPLVVNAAADYATYFTETSFNVPSTLGAKVYYVNEINEFGNAELEEITGVVYKETGIIVKFETETEVTYAPEFVSPGATPAVEGNLLKGTTKKTLISKDASKAYYVLGMPEGVVGLYKAVNDENENEFYNGAFKAYLEVDAAQAEGIASYSFRFGEGTTGVEKVEIRNEKSEIYDLTGRRVENITAPGIYVVGGKKVLVK